MPEANSATSAAAIHDDEIDLRELFLSLWEKRLVIALSGLFTLAVSTVYAFAIANPIFESSALLLPTQTSSPDQLSSAAALLGKKTTASNPDVDLYQGLLTSRTVTQKLLRAPMRNQSDTAKGRIEPLYRILGLDTSSPIMMERAVAALSASIFVDSKSSGVGNILEIKFDAPMPWLAQEIGNAVLEIGQEEIRSVRAERAEATLPRLSVAATLAKAGWDSAARIVTWYKDRNRSITLPEQILELSRLQMEQQVQEQKYLLARKEYETQVLEKAKASPPMMILDPANLPAHKSGPKRALILVLGLASGIMCASVAVLGWKTFHINPQGT